MVAAPLIVIVSSVALSDGVVAPHGDPALFVAPGVVVERDATSGRTLGHLVELRAGQYVRITVEPQRVAIVATLRDPSGAVVTEARDPEQGDAPVRLSAIVERSGVHALTLVVPGEPGQAGRYRLTVEALHQATETDRLRVRAARAYGEAGRLQAENTAEAARKAKTRFEEGRAISHGIGDAREEADALAGIAHVLFVLGSMRESQAATEDALALYRAAGDRRDEATMLNNLGVAAWSQGDFKGALPYYERALPIAHELGLVGQEAQILSNIGTVHKDLGDARTALAFYERSLPLRRAAGARRGESATLSNIGVASRILGDRRRALSAYEQALSLARATDDVNAENVALQNLGALSVGVGDLERGEDVLGSALALSRRIGDRRGEGMALGWLSHAQRLKGNYPQAVALTDQELILRRAIGDRSGESVALTYLGTLQRLQGATAAAEDTLSAALRLQQAIEAKLDQAYTWLELAELRQDAGDLAAADRLFAQVLATSRSLGDRGVEAAALFHTAQLRRLQGKLDDARRGAEAAVAVLESLRTQAGGERWRASFFASAQDTYELLIDLLMTMDAARPRQGLALRALEASERKRARSLLDQLTESGVEPAAPDGDPVWTLDPQRLLDDRTVLLEFSLGEAASYAWAIRRSGVYAARLAPRAEITAAARAVHDVLAVPPPRDAAEAERRAQRWEAAGAALTHLLLEPLAAHLDAERVAIVADGSLHYVPFAALPEPRPGAAARHAAVAAVPLITRHEIVFLPSVTALERLRAVPRARGATGLTIAVLADPVFEEDDPRIERRGGAARPAAPVGPVPPADLVRAARDVGAGSLGSAFPRLIHAREEAEAILHAAAPGSVMSALDFDASRSTALSPRLAGYDIVHFATHGFFNDAWPELSGLVLSMFDRAGRPQDGFVRLRDVHDLRLPVELVVLSGCRTGLGKEVRGEGLLGIVRAFMYAGARRVVASVWDVDDRAAAVLMKAFYEAMLTSGLAPASALREAQRALRSRERWRDPFYWAAFVLEGEWN